MSPDGNDGHDGFSLPVETLKRAVEIATANPDVSDIVLAAGRYTMRQGETFPYKLPPNVLGISGAPGGGSVLVGTGAEDGLSFESAQLQDLELESFATAIDARGTVRIKNLRITGSVSGIRAHSGTVRIDDLEIAGAANSAPCATGLTLDRVSDLTLTGFTAQDVLPAIQTAQPSPTPGVVDIANAMITLSPQSRCLATAINVSSEMVRISNSTLDGAIMTNSGGSNGLSVFTATGTTASATITGTTVRRWNFGLQIGGSVRIEHSEISDNTVGVLSGTGSTSLDDVAMARNRVGLKLSPSPTDQRAAVTMRNSRILDSIQDGLELEGPGSVDLGTADNPGSNTFTSTPAVGLRIRGQIGATQINAIGNRWTPDVQGADALGLYPARQTVVGPIDGKNFAIDSGWSLQL
ncbi:MAG TPA: DUF1565 domain-containing protein [Kofleriaceae bacterium]|nr:DUF1565 domain-containing protein [Kofleriaceae bacterium]